VGVAVVGFRVGGKNLRRRNSDGIAEVGGDLGEPLSSMGQPSILLFWAPVVGQNRGRLHSFGSIKIFAVVSGRLSPAVGFGCKQTSYRVLYCMRERLAMPSGCTSFHPAK
jgi:hypothetical protein